MSKIKTGRFIPLPVAPIVVLGANVDGRPNYTTIGFVSGVNAEPPVLCREILRASQLMIFHQTEPVIQ